MGIRAVLFDWDGTLVHFTGSGWPAGSVVRYACEHFSVPATEDDFAAAFRTVVRAEARSAPNMASLLGAAFAALGWPANEADAAACSELFFGDIQRGCQVFDDARALLASLKFRGYRMGVVTNSLFPGSMFEAGAADLGLAGYFDTFVSSADVGAGKPHPEIYLRALGNMQTSVAETLFVGDRVDTDITGALGVGMPAALIDRNGRAPEPDGFAVVERLTALNRLIGENPVQA